MQVRKAMVYLAVALVLGAFYMVILWSGWSGAEISPVAYPDLKILPAASFQLFARLNDRPDMPPPTAHTVCTLLVVLKNRTPAEAQELLLPPDEFSCAEVIVRPAAGGPATFQAPMGVPDRILDPQSPAARRAARWHSISLAPEQAIAKELVLPAGAFPTPGEYRLEVHWNTTQRDQVEGNVPPADRKAGVLNIDSLVTVTIPATAAAPSKSAPVR
ncbi:MAG: hypothetical protein ACREJ2_01975 [Planctomycetota bacterium]